MSDDHDLERREFLVASLAAVSAPAVLAAGAGAAQAREGVQPQTTGGTTFTGDVIQGKRVLRSLDVNDLEPGRHQFYFEGVQTVTGQHWYVSVAVARGARPGKRVLLTSGVHGDEMSSVRAVQRVMQELDPATMSGTVTAAFDISGPALEGMARRWPGSGRGVELIDMNRVWPGDENAPEAPRRHAGLLFNRLLRPNADVAIDFHTVSSGMDGTAFHFADMTQPEVEEMAMLFPIDQIFADTSGYGGTLMNELVAVGIPALTPELGYAYAAEHPTEAADILIEATGGMLGNDALIRASMEALVEGNYLKGEDGAVGTIDSAKVEAIGSFLFESGILRDADGDALADKPHFSTWFTNEYLPG